VAWCPGGQPTARNEHERHGPALTEPEQRALISLHDPLTTGEAATDAERVLS
jgi:hypothetical protein